MVQNELPRHESDIMGGGLMSLGGQPGAVEEGSVRHPQLLGPLVHQGNKGPLTAGQMLGQSHSTVVAGHNGDTFDHLGHRHLLPFL